MLYICLLYTSRRGIGLLAVSHDRELLDRICTRQIDLQAEQGAGR